MQRVIFVVFEQINVQPTFFYLLIFLNVQDVDLSTLADVSPYLFLKLHNPDGRFAFKSVSRTTDQDGKLCLGNYICI